MMIEMEIRERNRQHLGSLLKVKKALGGQNVPELKEEIVELVIRMIQEDVAMVENLIGVKAID
jgi:hypothetical protein